MKVVICLFLAVTVAYATPSKRQECGPMCLMYCPFGNVMDDKGCPKCECNWPDEKAKVPAKRQQQCGPLCMMYCPYGNVMDSDGCPICKCIWPDES